MRTTLISFLCVCLLLFGRSGCDASNTAWIETETFQDLGGWVNDAQFVDQMGSPYLLAIGLHGPVKDAVTRVRIPRTGTYRVWARVRDWVPEFSPGRFQIVVGDQALAHTFGQSKQRGWIWENGGVCTLEAGDCKLKLHDLTGYYGRCDCIVITDDLDYQPPTGREALAAARERFGGVSRDVKQLGPYDTVVVGGGLAGTFAAVAAARHGCRTALIQDRPVLGGNASTEILVLPQGDKTGEPLDPGEGGIIEEVRGPSELYSERMLKLARAEKNLDLYLNTHATGVEKKSARTIAAIKALNVITGQRLRVPGAVFIDCTGDGAIGVWAGAEYRHGREGRSQYGEPLAPPKPDAHTMGGTLRYASRLVGHPVSFKTPPWARQFTKPSDFTPGRAPQLRFGGWQWTIEYGGMLNTYTDAEEIRDELLRIIWGMWGYVKNYSPTLKQEARNYTLSWVSYVVGKRESRRLLGDYVLTEQDVANQVLFPDRVSYCGWGIDLHPPGGFYAKSPPAEFNFRVKSSVPFRCLYTKDIDNLMMAGRCISVSHVALGTTRVMVTCGLQGQAVGTAAALCRTLDVTPRQLDQQHINQLQQTLLADGCYLIDLPNRDPHDLAHGAAVTASSEASSLRLEGYLGRGAAHSLAGHDRAVMFRCKADRIRSIALYLGSRNAKPTAVVAQLFAAKTRADFSSTHVLAQARATLRPRNKGWVQFDFNVPVKPEGYYFIVVPKTAGLEWWLFQSQPSQTARAYRVPGKGHTWVPRSGCYCFRVDPAADMDMTPPPGAPTNLLFAPENITNGYARAVRGWPNSWRPDPHASLPQWVQLDFGTPKSFNTVHVSFQTKTLNASKFHLDIRTAEGWTTVARVDHNEQRRRVVRFATRKSRYLRLVIDQAAVGMGVCEVRVYDNR